MHDAPPSVAGWAAPQFRPQAAAPLGTPVRLSQERYGQVASSYVVCTENRLLAPALQRQMARRASCSRIEELPLSHSPFLSDRGVWQIHCIEWRPNTDAAHLTNWTPADMAHTELMLLTRKFKRLTMMVKNENQVAKAVFRTNPPDDK
jgi:hypothetical protein